MTDFRDGNSPKTLITGGAGFVGSHLCDRLIAEGHEVLCLDNLRTGSRANIQHLLSHPHFIFIRHDVNQPIDIAALWKARANESGRSVRELPHFDYVLHMASPASPKDYADHPIHTLKASSLGTHHALGLAKADQSIFLLASTSEVYGDPEIHPQPEEYWGNVNPIGPRSVYDEAKRFAEALTMAYCRQHASKVRIARIFNTYGERMRLDDGRVLPNFLTQALQGRPLTVYGDGSQTRSCCYVSDLVDGLYRLMVSEETGPINLGNPEEVTVLELARQVIQRTGSPSSIVFQTLPVDDPARRRPDITKATKLLGWRPTVCLADGIAKVIPYFRERLGPTCLKASGGCTSLPRR